MRNRQIDALRAWGILLVIAGHTGSPFSDYIYTFHMPLFFFISGFLRYQGKTENWPKFIAKKIKATLVPYLIFWFISMVIYRQLSTWIGTHQPVLVMINFDEIKGLLLGGHWLADYSNNFPLWYFQLFFIASIMFEFIIRYFDRILKTVSFFALFFITIPFQTLLPGRPVFHINVLPAALTFMLMGYFLHWFIDKNAEHLNANICFAALLLLIGWKFSTLHYGDISHIKSIWYFVGAFCTICGYYIICGYLPQCIAISYIGKNTRYILGLHRLTASLASAVAIFLMQGIGLENTFIQNCLTVLISLLLSCGWLEMYKNFKEMVSYYVKTHKNTNG